MMFALTKFFTHQLFMRYISKSKNPNCRGVLVDSNTTSPFIFLSRKNLQAVRICDQYVRYCFGITVGNTSIAHKVTRKVHESSHKATGNCAFANFWQQTICALANFLPLFFNRLHAAQVQCALSYTCRSNRFKSIQLLFSLSRLRVSQVLMKNLNRAHKAKANPDRIKKNESYMQRKLCYYLGLKQKATLVITN